VRLFGAGLIAVVSLMLPLLGGIFAPVNQRRVGDSRALRRTLLVFVAPGAALLVLAAASTSERLTVLR
jgi:hypothetical protein